MSHILEAGDFFKGDKERERLLLMGDARLLIVAGSDTTATTLVYCFYHFARDPSLVKKLRDELKEHNIVNDDSFSVTALQYLNYLNALINETLRMHPPVPGGVFRNTPRGGVEIDGKRLPGGVRVIGPHYTIQRCKSYVVKMNARADRNLQHHALSSSQTSSFPNAGQRSQSSSSTRMPSFPFPLASSAASVSSWR